jgi:hypothetical protein
MALLQQGNRNRTTEPTRANETSSRSHAVLQVHFLRLFPENNAKIFICCDYDMHLTYLLHLGYG